jgi:RNA-directed DNA polymerase
MMDGQGKSDRPVVPTKSSNKTEQSVAERAEGRDLAKGNLRPQNTCRTQGRESVSNALARIRAAAREDRKRRFTTLYHHITNVDALHCAFLSLARDAAAGVDEVTWRQYAEDLETNLQDLSSRLQRGAYRAKPTRRVLIPKPDGRTRPLGVTVLEDKLVQRATVGVLNAIYEVDFAGFSYGFRPGRSQHNALDALYLGLGKKVSWILDADIRGFFDAIDHGWLMKFVEHRIADQRVLRLIRKWLSAGVMEGGLWKAIEEGTPQGGSASPLLANIYLHYVFDCWAHAWRRQQAKGEVIVVRYADDTVVGFQYQDDARRFLGALNLRMAKFGLELHPEKTRLLEFGRFAASNRREKGLGKPETFNFLGLTHICGTTRNGHFLVLRHTMRQRLQAKLQEVKAELRRRWHHPVSEVGAWLESVVRGHQQYFGVPTNYRGLDGFRRGVKRLWFRALKRRGQKTGMTSARMNRLATRWLPLAKIVHPYPHQRVHVTTQGRSRMR